jgi:hypothetical protein
MRILLYTLEARDISFNLHAQGDLIRMIWTSMCFPYFLYHLQHME